jgi:hypothetical protein
VNRYAPGWVPPPPTDAEAPDPLAYLRPYFRTDKSTAATSSDGKKTDKEKGSPTAKSQKKGNTDAGTTIG